MSDNQTNLELAASRQTEAVAASGFEQRNDVRHAEEFADARAQVHQLQFAACASRRDVKPNHRAEPNAIHLGQIAEIEDHPPFVHQQRSHFRLQKFRGLDGEAARAAHHGRVFADGRVELKRARKDRWIAGHARRLFTLDAT